LTFFEVQHSGVVRFERVENALNPEGAFLIPAEQDRERRICLAVHPDAINDTGHHEVFAVVLPFGFHRIIPKFLEELSGVDCNRAGLSFRENFRFKFRS
jgi:hypothetical protein